jgi:hypothetical protein
MQFEASQVSVMLGPALIDLAVSDIPLFGEQKAVVDSVTQKALQSLTSPHNSVQDTLSSDEQLPDLFQNASSIANKMRSLRNYSKEYLTATRPQVDEQTDSLEYLTQSMDELSPDRAGPPSNRHLHEKLLALSLDTKGLPIEAQVFVDHIALLRANHKYLFDFAINREIVSDDPWLRDMWDWISGLYHLL